MNVADYIVLGVVAVIIVIIILFLKRKKKRCGSACGCCPHRLGCDRQNGAAE